MLKTENNYGVWGNCNWKIILTDQGANGNLKLQKMPQRPEHFWESLSSFKFFFSQCILFHPLAPKTSNWRKDVKIKKPWAQSDIRQRVFYHESGNCSSGSLVAKICSVHGRKKMRSLTLLWALFLPHVTSAARAGCLTSFEDLRFFKPLNNPSTSADKVWDQVCSLWITPHLN